MPFKKHKPCAICGKDIESQKLVRAKYCVSCANEKKKEQSRRWSLKNPEKMKACRKKYNEKRKHTNSRTDKHD